MRLEDAIKCEGQPFYIPDCSRDDLPQFFKDMGLNVGAEIGVYKARFTRAFASVGLTIYGIDPYIAYEELWHANLEKYDMRRQARLDSLCWHANKALKPYRRAMLVRKTSIEAALDFADGSLDFVYIDGNHYFKWVAEDLWVWHKKVKTGGIVSGHDWVETEEKAPWIDHVRCVVKGWMEAMHIPNWYILGRDERVHGERRDRWRSWMYVKP